MECPASDLLSVTETYVSEDQLAKKEVKTAHCCCIGMLNFQHFFPVFFSVTLDTIYAEYKCYFDIS